MPLYCIRTIYEQGLHGKIAKRKGQISKTKGMMIVRGVQFERWTRKLRSERAGASACD